jgi:hypothetical protein
MVSYFAYVDHHNVTQVLPVVLEAAKTGDWATFHAARSLLLTKCLVCQLQVKLLKLTILFTFPNETGQPPVDFVEIRVESHVNRSLNYTKEIVSGLDKNAVNKYLKEHYGR